MKRIKLSELIEALEFDSEERVTKVDLQNGCVVAVDSSVISAVEEEDEASLGDLPLSPFTALTFMLFTQLLNCWRISFLLKLFVFGAAATVGRTFSRRAIKLASLANASAKRR